MSKNKMFRLDEVSKALLRHDILSLRLPLRGPNAIWDEEIQSFLWKLDKLLGAKVDPARVGLLEKMRRFWSMESYKRAPGATISVH